MDGWVARVGRAVVGDAAAVAAPAEVAQVVVKEQYGARNRNSQCPVCSPRTHYQARHHRIRHRESIHTPRRRCYTPVEETAAAAASAAVAEAVEEAKAAQVAQVVQLVQVVARAECR